MIKPEDCNRDIKTYGDVIRHMTNDELAIFLEEMGGDIEKGIMAIMRAKMYPHRSGGDPAVKTEDWRHMHSFMEHRISAETEKLCRCMGCGKLARLDAMGVAREKEFRHEYCVLIR